MFGLRLLYLALGAVTACLSPFMAVILQARGFGPAEIGVVSALGAAGLVGAIAFWGHLGDAVIGRKRALQICLVVACVVAAGIAMPVPQVVLAALMIAFSCTQGSLLALTDSVAVTVLSDPRADYGRIRLLASFSFAVASIAVGPLYDLMGYTVASGVYLAIAASVMAGIVWLPHQPASIRHQPPPPARTTATRFGSTGRAFAVQPRLIWVLATVAITWAAVMVSFTYLSLRIIDVGGHASDVALSSGVSAFAEIPGMFLAARLAARIGPRGLFALSALGYGVAYLLWAVIESPELIVATRVLTGLAYAGLTVTMVVTIGELLPASLQSTGQALYQGAAAGVASVIGNSLGGVLYGAAGAPVLFVVCAAVAVAGGASALVTVPERAPAIELASLDVLESVSPPTPLG